MILSQVSSLDIIVFLLILTPQLLIHVGLWPTIKCAASALPFFRQCPPPSSTSSIVSTAPEALSAKVSLSGPAPLSIHPGALLHAQVVSAAFRAEVLGL